MKIKTKATIIFIFLTSIAFAGAICLFYYTEKYFIEKELRNNNKKAIEDLAWVCKQADAKNDKLIVGNYIRMLKKDEAIDQAMFLDNKNKITEHTNINKIGTILQDGIIDDNYTGIKERIYINSKGRKMLSLTAPVIAKNGRAGAVQIDFSMIALDIKTIILLENIIWKMIAVSSAVLILMIPVSIIFSGLISFPINRLIKSLKKLNSGDVEYKFKVKKKGETGEIYQQFSTMIEKLRQSEQFKKDIISSVTEKFKVPITEIDEFINFFSKRKISEISEADREVYVKILNKNTVLLNKFVDNIIDIAKTRAGELELNFEHASILQVAREAVESVSQEAKEKNITITNKIPGDISIINFDCNKIKKVMENLLSNAIKFNPEYGSVIITANEDKKHIQVNITDTGCGIPQANINEIFHAFHRTIKDDRNTDGAGLGLTLAKGIIEAHKGRIWVKSEPSKGSTFSFTLPK